MKDKPDEYRSISSMRILVPVYVDGVRVTLTGCGIMGRLTSINAPWTYDDVPVPRREPKRGWRTVITPNGERFRTSHAITPETRARLKEYK